MTQLRNGSTKMRKDNFILPPNIRRLKTFVQRQELLLKNGSWVPSDSSQDSLDDQVNRWVKETRCQIEITSAPQVSVYSTGDGKSQVMFTSLTLLYTPAVEQHHEQVFGRYATSNLGVGPPGTDPGDTAVNAKSSDGVSRRPEL